MYSQSKIAARIARASATLGFPVAPHPVHEIDQFEDHLRTRGKYLYDDHGVPVGTHNLTPDEILWMANEQAMVQCDHLYALTRYAWVKDEENLIGHFQLRTPQKILFDVISEMEAQGLPIEIMILKARQLGMSTLVELLLMLRVVFGYGVNAVVASAEVEKSGLMARMLFLAYDRLPVWLRPRATARAEESDPKKLVFGSLNTVLSVQHGGKMKGGIAQGWTPTLYHISEVALFPNPEVQIDEGLFRAVHPSASVFGVLESTGAGDAGWWPDTWHYSKSNWATRSCRLRPLFLPWFCGVEIYPKPDWVHAHPVPYGFYERRLPDTRAHVAKAEAYVAARPEIQRYLGTRWSMPLAQQWFWEVGHEEAKSKGRESLWYQAMAGDDIEALQRSAESIFGHDTIVEVDERRKRNYTIYGLTGQSIEANHEPSTGEIDYAKPRIPVKYSSNKGDVYRWELIPLLHDEHQLEVWQRTNTEAFKEYANGKLIVFHPPLAGVDYSVGIDTSNGIGSDSTVISVTAIGQRGGPDTQVAEFRSQYVSHVEAYAFAMVTCAYYASLMDQVAHREPLVAAEQLRSVGDTCQLQMRKMGYSRFHRFIRYDKMRIDKGASNQLGWMTTGWSRPLLIGGFIHSLTNGWYILNSPWTLHECAHFEQHLTSTGKPKPEHADGECDDGIFAAAISTFIAHDVQSMTERTKRKFMGDSVAKPLLDLTPYRGQVFSTIVKPPVDIDHLL